MMTAPASVWVVPHQTSHPVRREMITVFLVQHHNIMIRCQTGNGQAGLGLTGGGHDGGTGESD
jgi:hypothetical protein